eukprot:XP_011674565.1 PREDICTED: uncharacterized protein LOC105443269 [Strongylocentrotus purpuratus]
MSQRQMLEGYTAQNNNGVLMNNYTDILVAGLKASQVVPDGVVYTEVKKTLVQGVQGILTCHFYGKPLAVYWIRGRDPDDLSPMVVWLDGEVFGPRYDDGSCDVDENYSLIINNVSMADVGRMYCKVSNYKGFIMQNYTDTLVVDTAITTNPQATLQMRQATHSILQCTVHIKARRVSWKKGTTSSANESLVVIENNQVVAKRTGARYDGQYNITQDYSLVINQLQIHREGLYVCEVTDFDTGISFRNHTFVNVVAKPLEPFPIIQECLNTEQHDSNYCILVAKSGMTLTCQAMKYYPSINLVFLYGSRVLEPSDTREWNNTDGTKNKTITIATKGNKELYTCVASSIPGTNENKSTSVLLQGDEPVKSTVVVILVYFALMILISSTAYFIWRKKQQKEVLQALEQRLSEVLMQHYRRTSDCIDKKRTMKANDITDIRTALCDTHQMLIDWRESQRSTRNQETIDIETESAYACPSAKRNIKTISTSSHTESMRKSVEPKH